MVEDFGGQRMIEAVGILRSLNSDVQKQCILNKPVSHVEKMFHPGNKRIQEMIPNKSKPWCIPFFKTEIAYTKSLRIMNRNFVRKHYRFNQQYKYKPSRTGVGQKFRIRKALTEEEIFTNDTETEVNKHE